MTDTLPHLGFMLLETLPNDIEEDIRASLDIPGLNTRIERHTGGPYAGLELLLPTAIGVFIVSGFFNGFLQKAGEDSYDALKKVAKALWRRSKLMNLNLVSTPGKISKDQKFTLTYSITSQVAPNLNFKFLIQSEISVENADDGISAFLDLINDIHQDRIDDETMKALLTYKPMGRVVLVTFDPVERKIVPVNLLDELPIGGGRA